MRRKITAGLGLALALAVCFPQLGYSRISGSAASGKNFAKLAFDASTPALYVGDTVGSNGANAIVKVTESSGALTQTSFSPSLAADGATPGTVNGTAVAAGNNGPLYGKAISGLKLFGTKPVATDAAVFDTVYMIDSTDARTLLKNPTALTDFNSAAPSAISAIETSADHIFVALADNGGKWGDSGSCIRVLTRSSTPALGLPTSGAGQVDNGGWTLANMTNAALPGIQTLIGECDMVVDDEALGRTGCVMHWDSTLSRLFVGLNLYDGLLENPAKCAVIVGEVSGNDLHLRTVFSPAKASVEPSYKVVVMNTDDAVDDHALYVNKLKTMHTSTGYSYLITQADHHHDAVTADRSRRVYALPILGLTYPNGTSVAASDVGALARKDFTARADAEATSALALAQLYNGGSNDLVADEVPALVGGGELITSAQYLGTSLHISDMWIEGDTVFVASKRGLRNNAAGTTADSNEQGIFASTALFDTNGIIKGWTPWSRVSGLFSAEATTANAGRAHGIAFDNATGKFWMTYGDDGSTSAGPNTVGISVWGAGNATTNALRGTATLKTAIEAALPKANGGVIDIAHYDIYTTGLGILSGASNSWIVATGKEKVFIARTGTANFAVNTRSLPVGTGGFATTEIATLSAPGMGELYCSEVSRTNAVTSGWLFVGGQNGLGVWSKDSDGTGWASSVGLSATDTFLTAATTSFKKLTGITGPVLALRADGTNLYVMTDKTLYKFAMTAGKFKSAANSPDALAASVIFNCAADEYMLEMKAIEGKYLSTAYYGLAFIATTKGVYFTAANTDGSSNYTLNDITGTILTNASHTLTAPAGETGHVINMKWLPASPASAQTKNTLLGNLYITYGSVLKNTAKTYRYAIYGTAETWGISQINASDSTYPGGAGAIYGYKPINVSSTNLWATFDGCRAGIELAGLGYTWRSSDRGTNAIANLFKVTDPATESAAGLDFGTEPHYLANLLHSSANGALLCSGSYGMRMLE